MSQHDYVLDNQTGAQFRADLNEALSAIVSGNSGAAEPDETFAYMWWMDTTTNILKLRDGANAAWLEILKFNGTDAQLAVVALGSTSAAGLQIYDDPNTGLYSAGADLLGLVAGGTELLRADGILGYLKALGTAGILLPVGTTAQRPTGVTGLFRYNSDLGKFEGYGASSWGPVGGGGGGGAGFVWKAIGGPAPVESIENGEVVWLFGNGLSQELYASIKVPQSYTAGAQISLYVSGYSPSASNTILLRAQSTLIRQNTDGFDSTTNQRTTTNSALTNASANRLREFILDITDSSGQINSVAVSAGDVIKVRLYRDTDTDTEDLRMIANSTDAKFSV